MARPTFSRYVSSAAFLVAAQHVAASANVLPYAGAYHAKTKTKRCGRMRGLFEKSWDG